MIKKICMFMAAIMAFALLQVNVITAIAGEAAPLLCYIDTPFDEQVITDSVTVSGWAVYSLDGSKNALGNIEVIIDSTTEIASRFERADVKAVIKGYGDYSKSGFEATLDTSDLDDGEYQIVVRLWDAANKKILFTAKKSVTKGSEVKLPFLSFIDYPRANEVYIDNLYISGWSLNTNDGKTNNIGKVEVQVGTLPAQTASLFKRPDLVTAIRGYGDYNNSGFATLVNISELENGDTPVTIRFYDNSNKLLHTQTLIVDKQNDAPKPFIANIDSPLYGEAVRNSLLVKGWALYTETGASNDIGSIEIIVDDEEPVAPAMSIREDVKSVIPGYGDYNNSGFSVILDISALDAGTHTILANFYDNDGDFIGSIDSSFGKVSSAPKAFLGVIDAPAAFDEVSGETTVSGWALYTPDGDTNAISKVEVIANDEITEADLYVREDLKDAIGGYGDYENSGFTADIDLSELKGEQEITVKVYGEDDVVLGQMTQKVIAHWAPEISNVNIISSNDDPTKAVEGDTIILTFTADEAVALTEEFKICENAPDVFGNEGLSYIAAYTVNGETPRGEVTFSIKVKNDFGISSVAVEETSDESHVTVVDEAPIISDVSISSSNADPKRAISGDVITLSFKSTQAVVKSDTFKFCGHSDCEMVLEDGVYKIMHTVTNTDHRGYATFQLDVENSKGMKTSTNVTSDGSFVVIDTAAPIISNISISSDNPVDSSRAIVGDTISLTFTSNEPIDRDLDSFTICGVAPNTFTNEGLNYTATHIVTIDDAIGEATFEINVKNGIGLSSPAIEETTDDSSVTICGKPEITYVSIVSSNADPEKAVNGDVVTLTFTANEPVFSLSNFNIFGSKPDTFTTSDGFTYTATHVVGNDDARGLGAFQINVKNDLGLYSLTVEETTDGSSVTVVDEAPQILSVSIRSTNVDPTVAVSGDYVVLTFTTNEPVEALPEFNINGRAPTNFSNVGNTYTAIQLINSNDLPGVVTFQINVINEAELNSDTIEETMDGSSVTVM